MDVSDNNISVLPFEICLLKNLVTLRASQNRLESIDSLKEIKELVKLEELILDHNRLKSVNPQIGFMQSLKTLDLSHNQLTSCPKQIGWLDKCLRKLILNNNQIKMLPGRYYYLLLKVFYS